MKHTVELSVVPGQPGFEMQRVNEWSEKRLFCKRLCKSGEANTIGYDGGAINERAGDSLFNTREKIRNFIERRLRCMTYTKEFANVTHIPPHCIHIPGKATVNKHCVAKNQRP